MNKLSRGASLIAKEAQVEKVPLNIQGVHIEKRPNLTVEVSGHNSIQGSLMQFIDLADNFDDDPKTAT